MADVKSQPFGGSHVETHKSPLEQFPGAETVTVVSPKRVLITLDNQLKVEIKEGVQELPVEVADHWYAKANGVKRYEKESAPAKEEKLIATDAHVVFLRSRGYQPENAADAQRFIDSYAEQGTLDSFKADFAQFDPAKYEAELKAQQEADAKAEAKNAERAQMIASVKDAPFEDKLTTFELLLAEEGESAEKLQEEIFAGVELADEQKSAIFNVVAKG